MTKNLLLSIALMMIICFTPAYCDELSNTKGINALHQKMEDRRAHRITADVDAEISQVEPHMLFKELLPYINDPNENVRFYAECWLSQAAKKSGDTNLRKQAVDQLVPAVCDEMNARVISSNLLSFAPEDYSITAKQHIRKLMKEKEPAGTTVILCASANLVDQIPRLKELRDTGLEMVHPDGTKDVIFTSTGWAARLALARMGSKEDITYCIDKVISYPQSMIRMMNAKKYLGYICQPEVVPVFLSLLESEERLSSFNPSGPGTPFWAMGLDILVDLLTDFPVKRDHLNRFTEDDRAQAIKWIHAQKKFTFKKDSTEKLKPW